MGDPNRDLIQVSDLIYFSIFLPIGLLVPDCADLDLMVCRYFNHHRA